ncbi:DUF7059 domain-containing protein [Microlunatus endophyticus]|uniref:DUF7059 domain-containing protein n=1 Tax=Microlunatus endophyticus TaxID=1716077 RepID=UPI001E4B162C|nr:methyltransferase [Microlunatus endophyticus]
MLSDDDLARLRDRFRDADYTVDRILELVGSSAHAALGRNNTTPALRALRGVDDPAATLARLWPLQSTVGTDELDRALPGLTGPLLAAGILEADQDRVRARIDLRPYASDEALRQAQGSGAAQDSGNYWIFSDLTPGLDGPMTPVAPDFVLGVSPASMTLAELTIRRPVSSALDLGTGCGVQSLHLARHAQRVVATDINTRALALARASMGLNGIETVEIREGSLYEPVGEEAYDLIVTNPPYVMSPPGSADLRLTYREAGLVADDLVRQVVVDGARHLNPGGTLQVLGNWAQLRGQDWQDRLAEWVRTTGCDAHILRRETLDAFEYIEIWLADAGLVGDPGYREAYETWCDYFDQLGIESVGMGWFSVTKAGRVTPAVTIEDWPHPVEQPIGAAWAARIDAVDLNTRLSDAEVLATRWKLAPDVSQETVGRPGAEDPEAIVFRQQRGLRRAVRVDTALAGVLGACDGDLTLQQIVVAVAGILEVDADRLAAETLDGVRPLIVDNLLTT